jgi:hypothetical protein
MEIVLTFLYVYINQINIIKCNNVFVLLLESNVQFPCSITHPHRHMMLLYALIMNSKHLLNVNYKDRIN